MKNHTLNNFGDLLKNLVKVTSRHWAHTALLHGIGLASNFSVMIRLT